MTHYTLQDIKAIIDRFPYPKKVKKDAYNVYLLIAKAESKAHQQPVELVHFHEVGTIDAIVDVTTVCYLINKLGVDQILSTPIATGYGKVKCAHGILPVPAPATRFLLEGLPNYNGEFDTELCTPTGAALIRYFTDVFVTEIPEGKTGIGCGKKKLSKPNVFKATLVDEGHDQVTLLECDIDDMSGEELGYATEKLRELEVKDVNLTPIIMKKSRPGFRLSVLTDNQFKEQTIKEIFKLTSTLGIREIPCKRNILSRENFEYETSLGKVHEKKSSGFGTENRKFEFEDLKRLADENNLSLKEVRTIVLNDLK